jgi:hypothetical protein
MLVSFGSHSRRCGSDCCLVSFGSPIVGVEFFPPSFKFCVNDLMIPVIHFLMCFSCI